MAAQPDNHAAARAKGRTDQGRRGGPARGGRFISGPASRGPLRTSQGRQTTQAGGRESAAAGGAGRRPTLFQGSRALHAACWLLLCALNPTPMAITVDRDRRCVLQFATVPGPGTALVRCQRQGTARSIPCPAVTAPRDPTPGRAVSLQKRGDLCIVRSMCRTRSPRCRHWLRLCRHSGLVKDPDGLGKPVQPTPVGVAGSCR